MHLGQVHVADVVSDLTASPVVAFNAEFVSRGFECLDHWDVKMPTVMRLNVLIFWLLARINGKYCFSHVNSPP